MMIIFFGGASCSLLIILHYERCLFCRIETIKIKRAMMVFSFSLSTLRQFLFNMCNNYRQTLPLKGICNNAHEKKKATRYTNLEFAE